MSAGSRRSEYFFHETSVVALTSSGSALHSSLNESPPSAIYQGLSSNNYLGAGILYFDLTLSFGTYRTIISDDDIEFSGLPLIGFVAENFVNNNVTPGVLANYSAVIPHRSTLKWSPSP